MTPTLRVEALRLSRREEEREETLRRAAAVRVAAMVRGCFSGVGLSGGESEGREGGKEEGMRRW